MKGNNFHAAASIGNLNKCKQCIENGNSIDCTNEEGNTPFMLALQNGHWEVAEYLVSNGADISRRNQTGKTAIHLAVDRGIKSNILLHYAVLLGDISLFKTILSFEVDVNYIYKNLIYKNSNSISLLHLAAAVGHIEILNLLLEKGAIKTELESKSLMHFAVMSDNIELLSKIVNLGLDIDSEDWHGNTPLFESAKYGKLNSLNFLLDKEANWKKINEYNQNLLHYVCLQNNTEVIAKVVNLRLDIDSEDCFGDTPLLVSARNGQLNSLNCLLEKGANWRKTNQYNDQNLLHYVCHQDNTEMLAKVFNLGLDIESEDSKGDTPLFLCAQNNKLNSLNFLFEKGANWRNVNRYNGQNLLHYMCLLNNAKALDTVLNLGLDIDSEDSKGDTPLFLCAQNNKLNSLNFLLEKGANWRKVNRYSHQNLLHYVCLSNETKMLVRVFNLGFEIDSEDSNGDTPLFVSARNHKLISLNFLLDKGANSRKVNRYKQNLWHFICLLNSIKIMKKVFNLSLDIDSEDSNGNTPLFISARYGKFNSLNFLLDKGANWRRVNQHKQNVLLYVCYQDKTEVLETVYNLGLDIESEDTDGNTPLFISARYGNLNCLHFLLDKGANWKRVNRYKQNLLHYICRHENIDVIFDTEAVAIVFSLGLDIHSADLNGKTPLFVSAESGNLNSLNFLLDKGADWKKIDLTGSNLLHVTVRSTNTELLEKVLTLDIDVNAKNNENKTPLDIVYDLKTENFVEILLARGAKSGNQVN